MTTTHFYIIVILLAIGIITNIISLLSAQKSKNLAEKFADLENDVKDYMDRTQRETIDSLTRQLETSSKNSRETQVALATRDSERFSLFSQTTNENLNTLRRTVSEMTVSLDGRMTAFQKQTTAQMETIRQSTEKRMADMQASNEKKLEEMRATVDEKLQKTLEERISQSFNLVNERLERVYKSLGEMQKVGAGVEDLKKVLSNVKTRGILGEVQLGAILEEILSPEQYETNIATKKGSADRVEFAVKLPGDGETPVYLPIDAKFPLDAYGNLMDAYDSGDAMAVQAAAKELKNRIKGFAKDIRTKYIDVPNTTDFAIMFLPTEGLYAEVVNRGLVEELQRLYRVNIAGPSTMAALLNSLQMGFRTVAIQKRSGEVWQVLGAVKTEFEKFEAVLKSSQRRLIQANDDLDKLIGTRTRSIMRSLRSVERMEDDTSAAAMFGTLGLMAADEDDPDQE